jgi:hypothetical protein
VIVFLSSLDISISCAEKSNRENTSGYFLVHALALIAFGPIEPDLFRAAWKAGVNISSVYVILTVGA